MQMSESENISANTWADWAHEANAVSCVAVLHNNYFVIWEKMWSSRCGAVQINDT